MKEIEEENGWELHYSMQPNCFGSRGPSCFPPIHLGYVIEVRAWEIAVEGLGKVTTRMMNEKEEQR